MLALLLATALADAPRDRPGEVLPDRHWDFRHLHLDLRVEPSAGRVEGTATHTVAPLPNQTGWLRLHGTGLEIRAVRVDGAEVTGWRQGDDTLDVPVAVRGGERTVAVDFSASPQNGMHFRAPGADPVLEAWTQGEAEENRFWFPGWDHPSDRYTYSAELTVPEGLVAVTNGALVARADAGGWTRWSYRLDQELVGYLVAVAVGDYAVYREAGPVPLEYLVARGVDEATARRTMGFAKDQLAWFGELLGAPYPYPVYRQVAVSRFLHLGMENTTTTVLADTLLLREAPRDEWTETVVAHEAAHQWFGDLLTCYGWRELWLNEGFATYYAWRWMEREHGEDYAASALRDRRQRAIDDASPLAPRAWSKVPGRDHGAVYARGAAVLRMLEVLLGRDAFDAAIRRYVAENRDRLVETDDLRRVMEDASGRHLGWLFDAWVHGGGAPEISTSWTWSEGEVEVAFEQAGAWELPVDVEIGTASGTHARRLWVGPGTTRLVVQLDSEPWWVAVDPAGGTLARWEEKQPAKAWVRQLGSPSAYARVTAIDALGDGKASDEALAALRDVARDPGRHDRVRIRAVEALGRLAVRAPLLEALGSERPRVREAAADALGTVKKSPDAAKALEAALADPDPVVRASALQALASHDRERALALARKRLERPDPSDGAAEHRSAVSLLGEHGGDADIARLLPWVAADRPHGPRTGAAWALAELVERSPKPDARRGEASRAVLPLLDDADLRVRGVAIAVLGRVGDEDAANALRAWAKASTTDLGDRALDAAARIRGRSGATVSEDDAERLQERLDALEERLERLEDWR